MTHEICLMMIVIIMKMQMQSLLQTITQTTATQTIQTTQTTLGYSDVCVDDRNDKIIQYEAGYVEAAKNLVVYGVIVTV